MLDAVRGAALFYPSAGEDWREPLELFAPAIAEFWFVDVASFARRPADVVEPLIRHSAVFDFQEFSLSGPALAPLERRVDPSSGRSYPFVEPCTVTEVYVHRPTKTRIRVHRRRGFSQRSISMVPDMSVFFHRGDSPADGGSNVHWLSNRWISTVLCRLRDGGVVVTDGSLADARQLRRFHRHDVAPELAFERATSFNKWGRRWTCVGWGGTRYGPTLIWQTRAVSFANI